MIRGTPVLVAVGALVWMSAVDRSAGADVTAAGIAPLVERSAGDLVLQLPGVWEAAPAVADDEGLWFAGPAHAPDVSFAVLRDRALDELGREVTIEACERIELLGGIAQLDVGRAGDDRVLVATVTLADGSTLLLVGFSRAGRWEQDEPQLREIVRSVRRAGIAAEINPAPAPGVAGPENHATSSRRWYLHGRGDYRLLLPEGWSVLAGHSLQEVDRDFDTLTDPTGQYQLVCARVGERVSDVEAALARWRAERQPLFQLNEVSAGRITIGGAPGLRIAYYESDAGAATTRMTVVAHGRRYAMTAYAPHSVGIDALARPLADLLGSIEFLRPWEIQAEWPELAGDGVRMRYPPDWDGAAPPLAICTRGEEFGQNWFMFERATDRTAFMAGVDPPLKTSTIRVDGHSATTYFGELLNGGGTKLAVVLDAPDAAGRWLVFHMWTPTGQWERKESVLLAMLDSVRIETPFGEPMAGELKPRPAGRPQEFRVSGFRGEGEYTVTLYQTGATIRDARSGAEEAVFAGRLGQEPAFVFQKLLAENPQIATQLGSPRSSLVPVFQDSVRVQLFERGAMLSETAYRAWWWCRYPE